MMDDVDALFVQGEVIASAAQADSVRRPDVWTVADGAMELGIAAAGLIGGVYGLRVVSFLKQAREKSRALKEIIEGTPGIPGATVHLAPDGVRVDLDTAVLFARGSAVIKDDTLDLLRPLMQEILKTEYLIDIEGHTDDVPYYRIEDGEIDTNWSLSGKRASSVILYLRSVGFSSDRLRAVGYAHTRPVVEIEGKTGDSLETARARNRRVSLLIR